MKHSRRVMRPSSLSAGLARLSRDPVLWAAFCTRHGWVRHPLRFDDLPDDVAIYDQIVQHSLRLNESKGLRHLVALGCALGLVPLVLSLGPGQPAAWALLVSGLAACSFYLGRASCKNGALYQDALLTEVCAYLELSVSSH